MLPQLRTMQGTRCKWQQVTVWVPDNSVWVEPSWVSLAYPKKFLQSSNRVVLTFGIQCRDFSSFLGHRLLWAEVPFPGKSILTSSQECHFWRLFGPRGSLYASVESHLAPWMHSSVLWKNSEQLGVHASYLRFRVGRQHGQWPKKYVSWQGVNF
jgi:hypothetical protein